jgi:hypothetical protein
MQAPASTATSSDTTQKKAAMSTRVHGAFDVKITPQAGDESPIGRMVLDKTFHGDLDGTSKGQMLTADTQQKDSGVYVAIERVTGSLSGRTGSFALHHTGIMVRGVPQLAISVVPDSGTDQLVGLTGTMAIEIEKDGKHFYDFTYTLPAVP